MTAVWNSVEGAKRLALALMSLALLAIAVVLVAGQKMTAIQGPGTLGVTSAGTLWVVVNENVWALDARGRRVHDKTLAELGLTEPPSNMVLLPDGNMLVAARGDEDWLVLDPKSFAKVRTIRVQWPEDFRGNARALHIAVSPAGRIAAATGGGHAVLLFDADGRYLKRTAPGTYYFTNGLWHSDEGWWTTDTNRSRVHLLDEDTFAVKRSITLPREPAGYWALGEFVPWRGESTGAAPFATVTRLGEMMEVGHVADVFADGTQAIYDDARLKLRDIAWFGGRLVAVDGGSFRLLAFGADRRALGEFGDAEVRALLRAMNERREFWTTLSSRWGFVVALLLLLAGVAAHARHTKLRTREVVVQRPPRSVGAGLRLSQIAVQRLWIYGLPMAIRVVAALVGLFLLFPLLTVATGSRSVAVAIAFLPLFAAATWQQWRHEKLMRDPRYEPVLNMQAHRWLHDHADWEAAAMPDEAPRESIVVTGWNKRWLLVTDKRVLLFAASARERRLQQEWPRGEIVYAGAPQDAPGGRPYSLLRRLMLPSPNLLLLFADGTRLTLRCGSTVSAGRAGRLLTAGRRTAAAAKPRAQRARPARRWREVIASFVVPGTGQWLQARYVTGTVMFTAGLVIAVFVWGPVVWAASGPKTHVSFLHKELAAVYWLFISIVAAADAFRFSWRRR